MIPLLLGAGRMMAGAAVRGAASQSVKGAIVKTAKNKVKEKAVTISKEKLLNRESSKEGGGGALVKQPVSSVVKSPLSAIVQKSDDTEKGNGTKSSSSGLLPELVAIKSILESIKKVIDSQSEFDKNEYDIRRKSLELSKRKETEAKLEEEGDEDVEESEKESAPQESFFEKIKRFLLFTFLGSIANWAFKYLPKIIDIIGSIAKGIDSTLEVIKFAVVSIATNFPKQIKFLAKLTKKLFVGPAKLIGKLILKTGKFAFGLLSKAGSALLNFVKAPIQNITKRVIGSFGKQAGGALAKQAGSSIVKSGGQQAAKQGGKEAAKQSVKSVTAGNSAKLIRRLGAFRRVFQRVPVIGALIAVGIDLALGEPLDRAVVGAIGSTIGAAIGGAIGTGIIPIPIVGTAVGGVVGGAIGDWLAKKLYGDLTGRVSQAEKESQKSEGGISKKFFGGLSRGTSTRKTQGSLNSGSLTRKTGTQKRSINKVGDKLRSMFFGKGSEIKPLNENEVDLFKSKSRDYLLSVMNIFNNGTFVGDLLKLGSYMTLGKVVKSSDAESVANTLSNEFYNSPFTKDISDEDKTGFTHILKKWAKDSIVNNILGFQNSISPLVNQRRSELGMESTSSSESGPGSGSDGEGGGDGDAGAGGPDLTAGPIAGGPMHQKGANIAKELMKLIGIKDYQAAAIIGNLMQESSLVPDRVQGSGMRRGTLKLDGKTGYSYAQWTYPSRQQAFANYMQKKGHDWRTKGATDQLATGFLATEFKEYMSSVFTGTKNVSSASNWVLKNYEKPADKGPREQKERAHDSAAVLAKMAVGGNNQPKAAPKPEGPKKTSGGENPNSPRVMRSNAYLENTGQAQSTSNMFTSPNSYQTNIGKPTSNMFTLPNSYQANIGESTSNKANIGKSTSNISTKSTQLRTQASYESTSPTTIFMQMPPSQQPPAGGSNGQRRIVNINGSSIDIERILFTAGLY